MIHTRRSLRSTPFPYTTLFRSEAGDVRAHRRVEAADPADRRGRVLDAVPACEVLGREERIAVDERGLVGRHAVDRAAVRVEDQRSEEHTSELQSRFDLVCRLLL